MTSNQIAYLRLLEDQRSNRAKEHETSRSNMVKESLEAMEISRKTNRDRADVSNTMLANQEVKRANMAREAENVRHNLATESLGLQELAFQDRSYKDKIISNEKIAQIASDTNLQVGREANASREGIVAAQITSNEKIADRSNATQLTKQRMSDEAQAGIRQAQAAHYAAQDRDLAFKQTISYPDYDAGNLYKDKVTGMRNDGNAFQSFMSQVPGTLGSVFQAVLPAFSILK